MAVARQAEASRSLGEVETGGGRTEAMGPRMLRGADAFRKTNDDVARVFHDCTVEVPWNLESDSELTQVQITMILDLVMQGKRCGEQKLKS